MIMNKNPSFYSAPKVLAYQKNKIVPTLSTSTRKSGGKNTKFENGEVFWFSCCSSCLILSPKLPFLILARTLHI